MHKLTLEEIAKLDRPGRYSDGGGLYLQVQPAGTKSWLYRYKHAGKENWLGLGRCDLGQLANSVQEARRRAAECREQLARGIDPLAARRQQAALKTAPAAMSFEQVALTYIGVHEPSWKNAVHRHQWRATLKTYAFPHIGRLPVDRIDVEHVPMVLAPIWRSKSETARRVRGRCEAILDYAIACKYRTGANPFTIKLARQLLGKGRPRVKHHASLPYKQLPALMRRLEPRREISSKALQFTILTAVRSVEARFAEWSEFDFDAKTWTLPAHRMKAGQTHVVPLSMCALALLESIPKLGASPYLFVAQRYAPVSDTALRSLLRKLGISKGDASVHGFRSSFRDWAAENGVDHDIAETCLAHTVADKTVAAYKRTKFFEARRGIMEAWGLYLES